MELTAYESGSRKVRRRVFSQTEYIPTPPPSPPTASRPSPGDQASCDTPSPNSAVAWTFVEPTGYHRANFPSGAPEARTGPRCWKATVEIGFSWSSNESGVDPAGPSPEQSQTTTTSPPPVARNRLVASQASSRTLVW